MMKKQETGSSGDQPNVFKQFLDTLTGLFRRSGTSAPSGERQQGKVKWFSNKKGYGFITTDTGKEIFVHHSGIQGKGYKVLNDGQRVEFEVRKGQRGDQAFNVKKI